MYAIRSYYGSPVDHLPQFLADLEKGNPLLGNEHFLAGLGIPAFLGPAHTDGKAPEPADLDLLAPLQGIPHVLEDRVHDHLAFLRNNFV